MTGGDEGSMLVPDDAPQDSMLTPDVPAEGPSTGAGGSTGTPEVPPDMAADSTADDAGGSTSPGVGNPAKDPSDWVTGDEPMTGPQRSYLETLSREAGEEFDDSLTKAQASQRIDELQGRTGRGQP